ncbi:hypothetical protein LCGC14_3168550 [marine sediment metagenome]|uniref:Uncharacterized protein n=1 Tax=marine sediment metagenome TaxID=412755 RepID=A0A0F8W5F8_9ZZZZ
MIGKFDLAWLKRDRTDMSSAEEVADTVILARMLVDEEQGHDLKSLGQRYRTGAERDER